MKKQERTSNWFILANTSRTVVTPVNIGLQGTHAIITLIATEGGKFGHHGTITSTGRPTRIATFVTIGATTSRGSRRRCGRHGSAPYGGRVR